MNRLAELRKKQRLTQKELAQRVKVSPKTIGAYETGLRKGPVEKWRAIAKALGVKLETLLADSTPISNVSAILPDYVRF